MAKNYILITNYSVYIPYVNQATNNDLIAMKKTNGQPGGMRKTNKEYCSNLS